jgi:tRNA G18 (ribose-2'-O)-methylase SpoU
VRVTSDSVARLAMPCAITSLNVSNAVVLALDILSQKVQVG